jgi:small subunit ribosomal protein S20
VGLDFSGKSLIFAASKINNREMANHKSSLKRIRSNDAKRVVNRYQAKSTRTVLKKIRGEKDKKTAEAALPKVISMLDKLAKKSVIHKNKASNIKSKLTKHVAKLGK